MSEQENLPVQDAVNCTKRLTDRGEVTYFQRDNPAAWIASTVEVPVEP